MRKRVLHDLFRQRLEELAGRAMRRGLKPADILLVCLDVDDQHWRHLADVLMPNQDWDQARRRGLAPVALGLAKREGVADVVALVVPDVARALRAIPQPGTLHAVFCGEDGADVYEIEPRPEAN